MRFVQALSQAARQYALQRRPDLPALRGYQRVDAVLAIAWTGLGAGLLLVLIAAIVVAALLSFLRTSAIWFFAEVRNLGSGVLAVSACCGLLVLSFLFRFRRPLLQAIVGFVKNVFRLLYYAVMIIFYLSGFASLASFIDSLSGHVESFLTSPIGLKPDYVEQGFGALWIWLCVITLVLGIAHLLLRGAKREWQSNLPAPGLEAERNNA